MKIIKSIIALSILFVACNTAVSQDKQPITEFELENRSGAPLIDVRTPEEFAAGHLPNAQNIDVFDEDFRKGFSKFDKNAPLYVYCRSGNRSAKAQSILKEMGFVKVINLEGGFMAWESAGKSVEK